mgnify:CR=1 FL=1
MKTKPAKRIQRPIPASLLLRAEADRLEILATAMPDKAQPTLQANVWAYKMSAAFLDSLGAPEKLVRYVPYVPKQ